MFDTRGGTTLDMTSSRLRYPTTSLAHPRTSQQTIIQHCA